MEKLSVLVLEDHPLERLAAVRILERMGVQTVLEAEDGHEALGRIAEHGSPVDVVLCDLHMDGMDGVEFIRIANDRELMRGIILASGIGDDLVDAVERIAAMQNVELFGRVAKPLKADALHTILKQVPGEARRVEERRFAVARQRPREEVLEALAASEFEPYYQPKVDLRDGHLVGVEALARWPHRLLGTLGPAEFLPTLEAERQMDGFTGLMLSKSLTQLQEWRTQGLHISVAVNIPATWLQDVGSPPRILALLEHHELPPDQLVMEVTESDFVAHMAPFLESITRLRIAGVRFSIDDFGTGYSAVQKLSQVPFSELKIDRSFVAGIPTNGRNRSIVASMIRMGHDLNMQTVAEGIETEAEAAVLRELGCIQGQGFLYSAALPGSDIVGWRSRTSKDAHAEPDPEA